MNRGFPSMTALLGLLAIAGYQNRDKLAEMLGGAGGSAPNTPGTPGQRTDQQQSGLGGLLGNLGSAGAAGGLGGLLSGGLGELVDSFRQNGYGEVADSWVGTGPNKRVEPNQLEQAIGPDAMQQLTQHTGLSREEILARLSRELPDAVDKYTPEGRLPT
ncbi:YidB family protein [Microvirga massiliensis]|uniref:YidB family protein n=1 Tax=Microvirga massiliensis TaxID=1033741 RepID=UPI00062BCA4F|nr:YidB family protein [Microvirga massiliensis]